MKRVAVKPPLADLSCRQRLELMEVMERAWPCHASFKDNNSSETADANINRYKYWNRICSYFYNLSKMNFYEFMQQFVLYIALHAELCEVPCDWYKFNFDLVPISLKANNYSIFFRRITDFAICSLKSAFGNANITLSKLHTSQPFTARIVTDEKKLKQRSFLCHIPRDGRIYNGSTYPSYAPGIDVKVLPKTWRRKRVDDQSKYVFRPSVSFLANLSPETIDLLEGYICTVRQTAHVDTAPPANSIQYSKPATLSMHTQTQAMHVTKVDMNDMNRGNKIAATCFVCGCCENNFSILYSGRTENSERRGQQKLTRSIDTETRKRHNQHVHDKGSTNDICPKNYLTDVDKTEQHSFALKHKTHTLLSGEPQSQRRIPSTERVNHDVKHSDVRNTEDANHDSQYADVVRPSGDVFEHGTMPFAATNRPLQSEGDVEVHKYNEMGDAFCSKQHLAKSQLKSNDFTNDDNIPTFININSKKKQISASADDNVLCKKLPQPHRLKKLDYSKRATVPITGLESNKLKNISNDDVSLVTGAIEKVIKANMSKPTMSIYNTYLTGDKAHEKGNVSVTFNKDTSNHNKNQRFRNSKQDSKYHNKTLAPRYKTSVHRSLSEPAPGILTSVSHPQNDLIRCDSESTLQTATPSFGMFESHNTHEDEVMLANNRPIRAPHILDSMPSAPSNVSRNARIDHPYSMHHDPNRNAGSETECDVDDIDQELLDAKRTSIALHAYEYMLAETSENEIYCPITRIPGRRSLSRRVTNLSDRSVDSSLGLSKEKDICV